MVRVEYNRPLCEYRCDFRKGRSPCDERAPSRVHCAVVCVKRFAEFSSGRYLLDIGPVFLLLFFRAFFKAWNPLFSNNRNRAHTHYIASGTGMFRVVHSKFKVFKQAERSHGHRSYLVFPTNTTCGIFSNCTYLFNPFALCTGNFVAARDSGVSTKYVFNAVDYTRIARLALLYQYVGVGDRGLTPSLRSVIK